MDYPFNPLLGNRLLPVDIVLAPEWWYKNEQITFDRDFFFHPVRRVEVEKQMENALYQRWGQYGLGEHHHENRPEIGAVHLACGFLLSEMMGCEVIYSDAHPPQVKTAHSGPLSPDLIEEAFHSKPFRQVLSLEEALKKQFGYVVGDINWGGILNLALDLRGEDILLDLLMNPDTVQSDFSILAAVIEQFTVFLQEHTGTTSISVNRLVRQFKNPVLLHSECSHTMISVEDYEARLLSFDQQWSNRRPYGIHYCGSDPHRMASSFAKLAHLDFLDVGWGGDVRLLRQELPDTFLNIRLSPIEITRQSPDQIRETIIRLVTDSGNPYLTGVCCINMDDQVTDEQIDAIFETVESLRKKYLPPV